LPPASLSHYLIDELTCPMLYASSQWTTDNSPRTLNRT
jgi:hypothetical protein